MKKVAILMATYNGEKYLREQLDSIIAQTFTEWNLFISDDMSKDNTIQILEEYQQKDSRIKEIWIHKSNHGAFSNFFNVMQKVKEKEENFDYYFYADQDDIWDKEKISKLTKFMEKKEKNDPNESIAVYSDLRLFDSNKMNTGSKISDLKSLKLSNKYDLIFKGMCVWGTALGLNSKLWEMMNLENISKYMPHDVYTSFYATIFGKLFYYDEPLVMYRRHEENVSHLPIKPNLVMAIKALFKNLKQTIDWDAEKIWRILYFFNKAEKSNQFTSEMQEALYKGGFLGIKTLNKYKITPANSIYSCLVFKFVLFFKLYKKTIWYQRIDKN